jgi:hypothetical protein
VDIRVECVTPDGLSAKKRVWFRGIFHLIGILGESPFVSKLRKVESAEHSVQWTGGYAPRFQAVCWAQSLFRQSGVVSYRPPVPLKGHNANRWAACCRIFFICVMQIRKITAYLSR